MKVKNILIGIAAALAAVSCNVGDDAVLPGAASDGLLKIRPRLQQLDVQTRNAENALIAYIPDSLKSARVQPIASSMIRENVYYYNLPEAATSVLFTNLASTAEENVRFGLEETGGLMVVLRDSTRAELSQEILLGGLSGILAGNATPYDVSIRRLSSKITARLVLTDANGTPLENTAEQLLAASVAIDSLGTFVRIGGGRLYDARNPLRGRGDVFRDRDVRRDSRPGVPAVPPDGHRQERHGEDLLQGAGPAPRSEPQLYGDVPPAAGQRECQLHL